LRFRILERGRGGGLGRAVVGGWLGTGWKLIVSSSDLAMMEYDSQAWHTVCITYSL
jgi:hypothetical protein